MGYALSSSAPTISPHHFPITLKALASYKMDRLDKQQIIVHQEVLLDCASAIM
jgi:hypothetical protein